MSQLSQAEQTPAGICRGGVGAGPAPENRASAGRLNLNARQLGAASFIKRYGAKYAYLSGAMYKGIASKELVVAMAKADLFGFLGTGGMAIGEIEDNIRHVQERLGDRANYGLNLICNFNNPQIEMDTVELYLRYRITCIEAAAFMKMTPALILYRVSGLSRNSNGEIECRHRIVAKVSRPEVAQAYLSPPPRKIVQMLADQGRVTSDQAEASQYIPMSHDICVEADSGGHTDQGNATVLLPLTQKLRSEALQKYGYREPVHVGLAGGIGTPEAAVAAFIMGADFILTGSINQCTVEAGISDLVKDMLQDINVQDTDYAPAGDMFELGARIQVLKRGVFFPARANKLFMLYNHYDSWDQIPETIRGQIEANYFKKTFQDVWTEVDRYHRQKGQQATLEKAQINAKHKMALVFRWYFAYSARLAFAGDKQNKVDFQVHVGPALGAFNQWVKGTDIEPWRNRRVADVGERLMTATADMLASRINALFKNGYNDNAEQSTG